MLVLVLLGSRGGTFARICEILVWGEGGDGFWDGRGCGGVNTERFTNESVTRVPVLLLIEDRTRILGGLVKKEKTSCFSTCRSLKIGGALSQVKEVLSGPYCIIGLLLMGNMLGEKNVDC